VPRRRPAPEVEPDAIADADRVVLDHVAVDDERAPVVAPQPATVEQDRRQHARSRR
jgi:hypothetical protein